MTFGEFIASFDLKLVTAYAGFKKIMDLASATALGVAATMIARTSLPSR